MDGAAVAESSPSDRLFDLGRTRYALRQPLLTCHVLPAQLGETRSLLREQCPETPGVYAFFGLDDRLLYVGMSVGLQKRLLSYFYDRSADVKQRRIAGSAYRIGWEQTWHPLAAALRELELIRRWKPKYNVRGVVDRSRPGYLYLSTEAAPRFCIGDHVPRGVRRWWGPLPVGRRTQSAVERLNYTFRLADCAREIPMRFAEQGSLFDLTVSAACMRGQTGTCAAPCVGNSSRSAYLRQIDRACDMLEGLTNKPLLELEESMRRAAAGRRFEHATNLRDALAELTSLCDQLETLRNAQQQYWLVYPLPAARGELWHVLAGGIIAQVLRPPRCRRSGGRVLTRIDEIRRGGHDRSNLGDLSELFLIASWFRKNPAELERTLSLEEAAALCNRFV